MIVLKGNRRDTLHVMFTLPYESEYYETEELISSVKDYFQKTIDEHNAVYPTKAIDLQFKELLVGKDGLLINKLVRDIENADVIVLEVSDQDINIMFSLGIALSYGRQILLLKEKDSLVSPTSVLGKVWYEYEESGKKIINKDFSRDLKIIIGQALYLKKIEQKRLGYTS